MLVLIVSCDLGLSYRIILAVVHPNDVIHMID
jgi:hypothetical protein